MLRFPFIMLAIFALTGGAAVTGCVGPTMVNVPALENDTAINNPNVKVVRQVEAAAVRYSLADEPIPGGFTLVLPDGTDDEAYFKVLKAVNAGAVRDASSELPTVQVRAVRVRGGDASVDLIRPDAVGRRLHTITLTWELAAGWGGVSSRPWAVDPDAELETLDPYEPPQPVTPAPPPAEPTVGEGRDLFGPDTPVR